MRNSVENKNRIGEMSVRFHYEIAQTSEATKRYLWNSGRRFRQFLRIQFQYNKRNSDQISVPLFYSTDEV